MSLLGKIIKITAVSSKVFVGLLSSVAVSALPISSSNAQERAAGSGASAGTIGGIATGTIVAGAVGVAVQSAVIARQGNNTATTLATSIVNNGGGTLNANNVSDAIQQAIAANPAATQDQWAAAINSLKLEGETLQAAITTTSDALGIETSDLVSSIVTNTYATSGAAGAQEQVNELRETIGNDTVNAALDNAIETEDELAGGGNADLYNG